MRFVLCNIINLTNTRNNNKVQYKVLVNMSIVLNKCSLISIGKFIIQNLFSCSLKSYWIYLQTNVSLKLIKLILFTKNSSLVKNKAVGTRTIEIFISLKNHHITINVNLLTNTNDSTINSSLKHLLVSLIL